MEIDSMAWGLLLLGFALLAGGALSIYEGSSKDDTRLDKIGQILIFPYAIFCFSLFCIYSFEFIEVSTRSLLFAGGISLVFGLALLIAAKRNLENSKKKELKEDR